MRACAFLTAAGFLLAGCGAGTPPSAYKHPRDQFFAASPLPMIHADFEPCFRTIDGKPGRLPDADCFRFTDPQRMRGVAVRYTESGRFYPGRQTPPPRGARSGFWVEHHPSLPPRPLPSGCSEGCASIWTSSADERLLRAVTAIWGWPDTSSSSTGSWERRCWSECPRGEGATRWTPPCSQPAAIAEVRGECEALRRESLACPSPAAVPECLRVSLSPSPRRRPLRWSCGQGATTA